MTRADIIRMAHEAGIEIYERKQQARLGVDSLLGVDSTDKLLRFADIVTADKQLEIEGLRLRLLSAEGGSQEAARAEELHRQAEALLTDDERQAVVKAVSAEREACAKVCDDQANEPECPERATYCADAIRARANKTGVTL